MPFNKNKLNSITQTLKKELKMIKNETVNFHIKDLRTKKDYYLGKAIKRTKN